MEIYVKAFSMIMMTQLFLQSIAVALCKIGGEKYSFAWEIGQQTQQFFKKNIVEK